MQVAKALQERHAGPARSPQTPPQQPAPKSAESAAAAAPERQLQSQRPPPQKQPQQQASQQETAQQQSQEQQQAPQHNARPDNPNAMSVVMVGAECAPWSKTGGWVCSCESASKAFDDHHQATLLIGCLPVLHSLNAFWSGQQSLLHYMLCCDAELGDNGTGSCPLTCMSIVALSSCFLFHLFAPAGSLGTVLNGPAPGLCNNQC